MASLFATDSMRSARGGDALETRHAAGSQSGATPASFTAKTGAGLLDPAAKATQFVRWHVSPHARSASSPSSASSRTGPEVTTSSARVEGHERRNGARGPAGFTALASRRERERRDTSGRRGELGNAVRRRHVNECVRVPERPVPGQRRDPDHARARPLLDLILPREKRGTASAFRRDDAHDRLRPEGATERGRGFREVTRGVGDRAVESRFTLAPVRPREDELVADGRKIDVRFDGRAVRHDERLFLDVPLRVDERDAKRSRKRRGSCPP